MDIVKIIGVGLLSLIIIIILKQYRPEYTIYASIMGGVIILTMLIGPIASIINLINNIATKTSINTEFVRVLIKITGIAVLTEFAVSVCIDSGERAIASKIDLGGKIIIVTLSIPIIQALMETVIKVLP